MSQLDRFDNIKKQFPELLEKHRCNVTAVCKQTGVSRAWYYEQLKSDPDFKQRCKDAEETVIDFVESRLYAQIDADVPASTMFFLKCRAKERGYIERSELTGKDGAPLEHKIELSTQGAALFDRAMECERAKAIAEYKTNEGQHGNNCVV